MNVSHASVYPEEYPSSPIGFEDGGGGDGGGDGGGNDGNIEVPRIRMKDFQGMPGTRGGLALRVSQFVFAAAGLCIMATTSDFPSVTAFRYLVAATGLQSLWSLSLAIIDVHALLVMRSLQNYDVVTLFTIGDAITSTLTFAAASAAAGITVLIDNDLDICAQNHCLQFETATAMAFVCSFTALPSFLFNIWSLASR